MWAVYSKVNSIYLKMQFTDKKLIKFRMNVKSKYRVEYVDIGLNLETF